MTTRLTIVTVLTIAVPDDSTDVIATMLAGTARTLTIPGPVTLATLTPDGEHVIDGLVLSVAVQSIDVSRSVV